MMSILSALFDDQRLVACGALFMATIPMQSFFGRMINYEAPVLFFGLLQLLAYLRWRTTRNRGSLVLLASAILIGGFFDWACLFFSAAIAVAGFVDWWTRREPAILCTAALASIAIVAITSGTWSTPLVRFAGSWRC